MKKFRFAAVSLSSLIFMACTLVHVCGQTPEATVVLQGSAVAPKPMRSLKDDLKPAVKDGGFYMEGFILWCPTVIKVGDTYHMFASRWPAQYGIGGWTSHSEMVRATSDKLTGPYQFKEVVMQKRPGKWDSERVHNGKVIKVGDKFVIYHIATANETGYAVADSIEGPWQRNDELAMPFSNPAPIANEDGSIYVFGRKRVRDDSGDVHRGQAYTAPSYKGPYTIVKNGDNLLPNGGELEDPTIWWANNQYNVVLNDWEGHATGVGKGGAQYYSPDGIEYHLATKEPIFTKLVTYDDGTSETFRRRERPFVYADDEGKAQALFTACLYQDERERGARIIVNPIDNYVPDNKQAR